MPTTRRRHMVTETDDIARALHAAEEANATLATFDRSLARAAQVRGVQVIPGESTAGVDE
jgi:rRNA-processing protein FCF1